MGDGRFEDEEVRRGRRSAEGAEKNGDGEEKAERVRVKKGKLGALTPALSQQTPQLEEGGRKERRVEEERPPPSLRDTSPASAGEEKDTTALKTANRGTPAQSSRVARG